MVMVTTITTNSSLPRLKVDCYVGCNMAVNGVSVAVIAQPVGRVNTTKHLAQW
jgi:hypothetical protein